MKYKVTCTRISNGYVEVDAESADAAMEYVSEHRDEIGWGFGEETIDYAEPVKNDEEL